MTRDPRGAKKKSGAERRKKLDYRPDRDGFGAIKVPKDPPAKPDFEGFPLASQFWDHIVPLLESSNLAVSMDTANLTALCEFYSMWRESVQTRAKVLDIKRCYELFDSVACKFGLAPKDRQKLREWEAPKEDDPFDSFLDNPVDVRIA